MVDHEGVGPDLGMVADTNRAEQNGVRSDEDVMPDVGVPPPAVLSRTAQCYVVEHHAVVADRGRLANHHPGSVVEEEPSADLRPRVDLDSGPEACHHGENARNQPQSQTSMNPVGKAIEQDCVERCMTEDDLEPTMRRRIILELPRFGGG